MLGFYLFLVAVLLFIWQFIIWRIKQYRLRSQLGLDGPPINFFIGTIGVFLEYFKKEGLQFSPRIAETLHKKYGETFGWYNGPFLDIVSCNADFAKEIFITQFSNFVDRQTMPINDAFPFLDGLLAISSQGHYGVGWKDVRSVVSPVFTSGKLKKMHYIVQERVDTLIEVLLAKVRSGQTELDIYDEFQSFTMDTIARSALGVNADSLHDRNDTFYTSSRKFFAEFNLETSPATVLFAYILPSISSFFRPFSSIASAERPLINKLRKVIEHRRQNYANFEGTDLIQLLLEQDYERQKNENKPPLSNDVIITNCFHFLLAGYETTSTALAFAVWCLATHSEIQEKLHDEVMKDIFSSGEMNYDKVMKCAYLDNFFREVLRRYPPVVLFTSRKCIRDTSVLGIKVPKGVTVTVPVHAIHWNEKYWDKPLEFDPERFTNPEVKKQPSWLPFGIGPRNCVGMRFAELEFKTALSALIARFIFKTSTETELKTRLQLILFRPLHGVNILLEER